MKMDVVINVYSPGAQRELAAIITGECEHPMPLPDVIEWECDRVDSFELVWDAAINKHRLECVRVGFGGIIGRFQAREGWTVELMSLTDRDIADSVFPRHAEER